MPGGSLRVNRSPAAASPTTVSFSSTTLPLFATLYWECGRQLLGCGVVDGCVLGVAEGCVGCAVPGSACGGAEVSGGMAGVACGAGFADVGGGRRGRVGCGSRTGW